MIPSRLKVCDVAVIVDPRNASLEKIMNCVRFLKLTSNENNLLKGLALALVIAVAGASAAWADIMASFVPVPSEAGTTPPAGYVSSELEGTNTTQWYASNMLVTLSSGLIFQDS